MQWFGVEHAVGVAAIVASCWGVKRLQRSWMTPLLTVNLVVYIAIAYYTRWSSLSLATCLPLHLCDFILIGALWLLLRPGRQQLAYDCCCLWAWSGSSWALLTPDLPENFPHYRYFEFFWGHGLIFVVLAQLEGWHRYGLQVCSWKRAALGLQVWIASVGALDWLFGWNYGYLMRRPPGGSLLDYLGPWPTYVLVADGLAVLMFWALCRVHASFFSEDAASIAA